MKKSRISKSERLVGATILFALTAVATPNIFSAFANARKAKAINNAKQIGICLTEFDNQYGEFPSTETANIIIEEGNKLPKGDTSNHFMAQLLTSKILDTEQVFHVEGMARTKKADNVFNTPETSLARGENGFGYVMLSDGTGLTQAYGSAAIPVAVAPVLKGGKLPTFQGKPFHGEGIALRLDCSVGTYKINKKGELLFQKAQRNIFLNGEDTLWGSVDTPDVKAPWLLPEEKQKETK